MRSQVRLAGRGVELFDLNQFARAHAIDLLAVPYCGRVLLEFMLRTGAQRAAVAAGQAMAAGRPADVEIAFQPARLLMQDYTAVPLLVDLAAVRDIVSDPASVNPALPVHVVIDHSVQAEWSATPDALARNEASELARNLERYSFLKWAARTMQRLTLIPPGQGIVHQINLERLSGLVVERSGLLFPDSVIGTDSHTTMASGLGVLGWGVGGLEAEALLLGRPLSLTVPPIVEVRLHGALPAGTTATDLALMLTHVLREHNVGGCLLEFTGPGVAALTVADRCTVANMAPEFGAMSAYFPPDDASLQHLRRMGRRADEVELAEQYLAHQHLLRGDVEPAFCRVIDFDLGQVMSSLAGPNRPDQHLRLHELPASFRPLMPAEPRRSPTVADGDVVIAAITSCTNTANPRAMLTAGLVARRAVELGLRVPTHVKTSLSPGSPSVPRYLADAGLLAPLETLGFHVAGFGCMTCNGGGGGLQPGIEETVRRDGVMVAAVLSGNRNFPNRVHELTGAAYLGSPALVVALALAGTVRTDLTRDALGVDAEGRPVQLDDLWPSAAEVDACERDFGGREAMTTRRGHSPAWQAIAAPRGHTYPWAADSTYVRRPPYVEAGGRRPESLRGARVLVLLGDDVSTDEISPVGSIPRRSPAGQYLRQQGAVEFNSYGARRGNHEVMARATFSNARLRNHLLRDDAGGDTVHLPTGERMSVYDTAQRYAREGVPLVVVAGRNYGMGSSRDWAAKGPWLLGVRAVLAQSFERIHRTNLCAMGILPLLLPAGESWQSLGITGHEQFDLILADTVLVRAGDLSFAARVDVASSGERDVLHAGGTLPYLLGELQAGAA